MLITFILAGAMLAQGETTPQGELRDQLISALRAHDAQVRSLECDYEIDSKSATRPAYTALHHWRNKGAKERTDYLSDLGRVDAFDGQVMRSHVNIQKTGDREGRINTGVGERQSAKPFPLCCVRFSPAKSLAEFIESSSECEVSRLAQPGGDGETIKVTVPVMPQMKMEFYFDDVFHLKRRELHRTGDDGLDFVGERYVFDQFAEITDASGTILEIPLKVLIDRYEPVGSHEWNSSITMTLSNVKLNEEIPDSEFVITFPPGMRVYDELQGMGWVGGPDVVELTENPGMPGWAKWCLYVGVPLLGLALILLYLRARLQNRPA